MKAKKQKQLFNSFVDVDTGEYHVSSEPIVLQSIALGSCVAMAVYDRKMRLGGLAHIMLPGKSQGANNDTKYAENAIDTMFGSLKRLSTNINQLEISLVGGGNVLQEGDIPDKVIDSILSHLKGLQLKPTYMRVGGIERRSIYFDVSTGKVLFTEGESIARKTLTKLERF